MSTENDVNFYDNNTSEGKHEQAIGYEQGGSSSCRLCGGNLAKKFSMKVLNKYEISCYHCNKCQSLQTEYPYWLDEAYAELSFNLDTGAVQRNINNFAACYALSKIFSVNNIVDFGAKDGLLCRFLRDHQINCYAYDKYARPSYCIDFEVGKNEEKIELVVAFEVLEHLPNPKKDLDELFSFGSDYILASTEMYYDQTDDWWYLVKESGQHVFFYSAQALNYVAQKYGYGVTRIGGMILFFKPNIKDIQSKIISAQTIMDGWIFQAIKSFIFLLPTPGVQADHELVKSKINQKRF